MTTTVVNKYKHKPTGDDVYIGRGSKWGNPFTHIPSGTAAAVVVATREEAIESYREYITTGKGACILKDLHELKDKNLVCFCAPKTCHGDILKELIGELYGTAHS